MLQDSPARLRVLALVVVTAVLADDAYEVVVVVAITELLVVVVALVVEDTLVGVISISAQFLDNNGVVCE